MNHIQWIGPTTLPCHDIIAALVNYLLYWIPHVSTRPFEDMNQVITHIVYFWTMFILGLFGTPFQKFLESSER